VRLGKPVVGAESAPAIVADEWERFIFPTVITLQ
jgi:hypothetical protein